MLVYLYVPLCLTLLIQLHTYTCLCTHRRTRLYIHLYLFVISLLLIAVYIYVCVCRWAWVIKDGFFLTYWICRRMWTFLGFSFLFLMLVIMFSETELFLIMGTILQFVNFCKHIICWHFAGSVFYFRNWNLGDFVKVWVWAELQWVSWDSPFFLTLS